MGSSFIAYGAVLSIMLLLGQNWLMRRNKSQEFFDSVVISAWGYVSCGAHEDWCLGWWTPLRNIDGDRIGLTKISNILPWVTTSSPLSRINARYYLVLRRYSRHISLLSKGQTPTKCHSCRDNHFDWLVNGISCSRTRVLNQYARCIWTHSDGCWCHSNCWNCCHAARCMECWWRYHSRVSIHSSFRKIQSHVHCWFSYLLLPDYCLWVQTRNRSIYLSLLMSTMCHMSWFSSHSPFSSISVPTPARRQLIPSHTVPDMVIHCYRTKFWICHL